MDELEEEKLELEEARKIFEKKAVGKPALKTDMPANVATAKSFSEEEESIGQQSNLFITLKQLFPRFPDKHLNTICQAVMVGRILHDSMLDRVSITLDGWIDEHEDEIDNDESLDFTTLLNVFTTAFEIGLGSKGREDIVEIYGGEEAKDLEKLAVGMDGFK